MYADDTNLTASGSSITEIKTILDNDITRVVEWLSANKLSLNSIKTEYMLIGSRKRLTSLTDTLNLSLNGVALKQTHEVKCLGLIIDENLTWKSHIENVVKKVKIVCAF